MVFLILVFFGFDMKFIRVKIFFGLYSIIVFIRFVIDFIWKIVVMIKLKEVVD